MFVGLGTAGQLLPQCAAPTCSVQAAGEGAVGVTASLGTRADSSMKLLAVVPQAAGLCSSPEHLEQVATRCRWSRPLCGLQNVTHCTVKYAARSEALNHSIKGC